LRVFGYLQASYSEEIGTPDIQKQIIEEYARRHQFQVDDWYLDPATEGRKSLDDREAGRELLLKVERGDQVVAARLDLLVRSLLDLTRVLDSWARRGVILHTADKGVFDPSEPTWELMIRTLNEFAQVKRDLVSSTTKEGLTACRVKGQKVGRWPEYGWRYERRWDARRRGHVDVKVPDERERQIMRKVLELRAEGYTIDQIRQMLQYTWKALPRPRSRRNSSRTWSNSNVRDLVRRGLALCAHDRDFRLTMAASLPLYEQEEIPGAEESPAPTKRSHPR
jgi:DNA invertase Pin-like site-specific DNA recombinase